MTKTINGLTVTTTAAGEDFVPIWRVSNADTRKITKTNLIGALLTGGGTIATGGYTLTVAGNSTINGSLVGNMTDGGTVATGGNTLTVSSTSTIAGSVIGNISGTGTIATGGFNLTLGATSTINGSVVGNMTGGGTVATGGFTLTVPATGTAVVIGTAQTLTALKTFSAGINLGNDTLSNYTEATWTPALTFGGGSTGITYSIQVGRYIRVGNVVTAWGRITLTNKGSSTGAALVGGLPVAATTISGLVYVASLYNTNMTYTGSLNAFQSGGGTDITLQANNAGSASNLTDTNFANNSVLAITLTYRVG